LTTGQVAQMLGVHPDTVLKLVEEGVLRAWQLTPGRPRRYRHEDVEALLADAEARMQGAAA
jgi:excisionase family DNA binding protein